MHNSMGRFWTTAIVASLLGAATPVAAPSAAQTAPEAPHQVTAGPSLMLGDQRWDPLSGRVNIDLRGASPVDLFNSFEEVLWDTIRRHSPQVGRDAVRIVVDPSVRGPVSICLQNVTLGTAMTAVCESIGCTWRFRADSLPFRVQVAVQPVDSGDDGSTEATAESKTPAPLDEPLQVHLERAEAATMFGVISRIAGYRVDLASELSTAPVKLELKAPLRDVLDAACAQIGCSWSVSDGVLIVRPR